MQYRQACRKSVGKRSAEMAVPLGSEAVCFQPAAAKSGAICAQILDIKPFYIVFDRKTVLFLRKKLRNAPRWAFCQLASLLESLFCRLSLGRSSDFVTFVSMPSHTLLGSVAVALYRKESFCVTYSSGSVRDFHPIPFSFGTTTCQNQTTPQRYEN